MANDGAVTFAGEREWRRSPLGMRAATELQAKARRLWPHSVSRMRLGLFCPSGFTPELRRYARTAGILLIGAPELTGRRSR